MKDYHINLFHSTADEGYIADIPDLQFCSAFGETPELALKEALLAKAAWLAACPNHRQTHSYPNLSPRHLSNP